jgi:hypothetical protein
MFYSIGPGISRSQVIRDNGHLPIEIRSNLTEVHRDLFFALIEWLSAFSNDKETKDESNAPIKRTPFSFGAVLAKLFYFVTYEGAKISFSVRPWEAFPALCNVGGYGQELQEPIINL